MFGTIVGRVVLKRDLAAVRFPFGDLSEMAGRTLDVLERNPSGDCLCLVRNADGVATSIVDVRACDVERFVQR